MLHDIEHPAITAYRKAKNTSLKVQEVFSFRHTPPSALVRNYTKLATEFIENKLIDRIAPTYLQKVGVTKDTFKDITWDTLSSILVYYATHVGVPIPIDQFLFTSPTNCKVFYYANLVRSDYILNISEEALEVKKLYEKELGPCKINIEELTLWYKDFITIIKATNRGTFEISPFRTINSFLIAIIKFAMLHKYHYMPIHSPQWYEFLAIAEAEYNVVVNYDAEVVPVTNNKDYYHKSNKSPKSRFTGG